MNTIKRVLAIGAHPDDIELGCGGTLAKLVSQGVEVMALVLTAGKRGADTEQFDRVTETTTALKLLGVQNIVFGDFPDTYLYARFNDVVKCIEENVQFFKPDRVYTMFKDDRHQDHETTFKASIIASRNVRQVLSYETPSSWPNFIPSMFEEIEPEFMEKKVQALQVHESQANRNYTQAGHLTISSQFRGAQIGLGPSEGFIPYKYVF